MCARMCVFLRVQYTRVELTEHTYRAGLLLVRIRFGEISFQHENTDFGAIIMSSPAHTIIKSLEIQSGFLANLAIRSCSIDVRVLTRHFNFPSNTSLGSSSISLHLRDVPRLGLCRRRAGRVVKGKERPLEVEKIKLNHLIVT